MNVTVHRLMDDDEVKIPEKSRPSKRKLPPRGPAKGYGVMRREIESLKRDHTLPGQFDEMAMEKYLYVRTDGNDNNDGLAFRADRALYTTAHACGVAKSWLDQGYSVKLHVQEGCGLKGLVALPIPTVGATLTLAVLRDE